MLNTFAIITAMGQEWNIIIKNYNLEKIYKLDNISFYAWDFKDKRIILAITWIWKIQSTIATSFICQNYKVKKIINIWIVGNLDKEKIKIWDVVLANKFVQHDVYIPLEWDFSYATEEIKIENEIEYSSKEYSLIKNTVCVTWDLFIDNDSKIKELKEKYRAHICDMESFAILSCAREYSLLDKCLVIKSVSDGAENDAAKACLNNLDFAMKNWIEVLEEVLNN